MSSSLLSLIVVVVVLDFKTGVKSMTSETRTAHANTNTVITTAIAVVVESTAVVGVVDVGLRSNNLVAIMCQDGFRLSSQSLRHDGFRRSRKTVPLITRCVDDL